VAEAGTQTVSEDNIVEVGTQITTTTTTVIAPSVKNKNQWTRRGTGPYS